MNPPSSRIALVLATGVIAPTLLMGWLVPPGRLDLGLGCAPFGWRTLLIVHLVASLPIGVMASAGLVRAVGLGSWWARVGACILLGFLGAFAVASLGDGVVKALEWPGAGFVARGIVRTVVACSLTLPWLVGATLCAGPDPRIPASPAALLVGATLAFLPPSAYAGQLAENRSHDLNSNLGSGRLLKAMASLVVLLELGDKRTVAGALPTRALRGLEESLARLRRDVTFDLPPSATPAQMLGRAFQLIQLERLDEAESMLRPLAETSLDALLLLGAIDRDRARWSDAETSYRRALALPHPETTRDDDFRGRLATAYDGLAEAARSGGNPKVAEQAYREAGVRLPEMAGYFSFQSGRHHLDGGRPWEAIARLQQAVRLDPSLEAKVRPFLLQARVRTPGCILGPADSRRGDRAVGRDTPLDEAGPLQ